MTGVPGVGGVAAPGVASALGAGLATVDRNGPVAWAVAAACVAAVGPAALRWLRVAQREHYLPGSVTRFALRWWTLPPANPVLAAVAVAGAVASWWVPATGLATAAAVVVGPAGLALRGRTSALAWTRRLRTLAAVAGGWAVIAVVVGSVLGPVATVAAAVAVAVPLLVDLAAWCTLPLERRLAGRYVDDAAARLARVAPTVVAITGSYGKTSTKGHVAHLVRGSRTVVATPASFNNRAGLARAVNEHLADGTEVFVAEMGTYGPGEIADLCRWCPPSLSVITAIGPVHLERFGSEDRIVEAKSEILVGASDVVLPVDDPRLAAVADRVAAAGTRVRRCSAVDPSADVVVRRDPGSGRVEVRVEGEVVAEGIEVPTGTQPTNLACAVAVALLLGVERADVADRLATLPATDHRLQAGAAASGALVLDDTYNSNPAGAAGALAALAGAGDRGGSGAGPGGGGGVGRRVVVTPGMVELGRRQADENRRFGAEAARVATDLLVVGRTNRRALEAGAASVGGGCRVVRTATRDEAVAWVRATLGPGDVVLYENDLPDHYP